MKDIFDKVLKQVNFSSKYILLCNDFCDRENAFKFKKVDASLILEKNNIEFSYSSKESLFFKEYNIIDIVIRFSFTVKNGLIEAFYVLNRENSKDRIIGRFNSFAKINNPDFSSLVKYPFPIATSNDDLEIILKRIISLHNEVIDAFLD